MKAGYVYILANKPHGTLYIGVTSNIEQRIWQHKLNVFEGFTQRYNVKMLVHLEVFSDIRDAIAREKALKFWKRAWKIRLIEENNPHWHDLAVPVCEGPCLVDH